MGIGQLDVAICILFLQQLDHDQRDGYFSVFPNAFTLLWVFIPHRPMYNRP